MNGGWLKTIITTLIGLAIMFGASVIHLEINKADRRDLEAVVSITRDLAFRACIEDNEGKIKPCMAIYPARLTDGTPLRQEDRQSAEALAAEVGKLKVTQ